MAFLPERRSSMALLAVFVFCFVAQGVSSASVGQSYGANKISPDTLMIDLESELTSKLFTLTGVRGASMFQCVTYYFNNITSLSTKGLQLGTELSKAVNGFSQNYTHCNTLNKTEETTKCKIELIIDTLNVGIQVYYKILTFTNEGMMVWRHITTCTTAGIPTVAPPTTVPPPTTQPPTTPSPTTERPTTPAPTTQPPTTPAPTTQPPTTPAPTTQPPTTPAPTTQPPESPAPVTQQPESPAPEPKQTAAPESHPSPNPYY